MRTSFLPPVAIAVAVLAFAFACGGGEEDDQPDNGSTSGTTVGLGCEFVPGVDLGISSPPESAPPTDCSPGVLEEGSEGLDFGGVQGRMAPVPPLPSGLIVVSDYYEFDLNSLEPAIVGLALPLTDEITNPSTVAFYSYVDGEWRRIADVLVVRGGRAEGGLSSFPPNLVVLREAP